MTDRTVELLQRWHRGDRLALDELMRETLPWLQRAVRPELTQEMRRTEDSMDLAQSAAAKFLRYGPRFLPASQGQYRSLMKRIAQNEIIDRRRRLRRVQDGDRGDSVSIYGDSVLDLAGSMESGDMPSGAAAKKEERAWVRLAMELLPAEDRQFVYARELEGRDWASVAEEFGMPSQEAARMRWERLKPHLGNLIRRIQSGHLQELVEEPPSEPDP